MHFPIRFIRGVQRIEALRDQSKPFAIDNIGAAVFRFNSNSDRKSAHQEASINWEDKSDVITFTLGQRKNGKKLFPVGVVIIPTAAIDEINSLPTIQNLLSFERAPLDENDPGGKNQFHGNILIEENTPRPTTRLLTSLLVSKVVETHPN